MSAIGRWRPMMICDACGQQPSHAMYMGIPMRVCFNHGEMAHGFGVMGRAIFWLPFNGVFVTYEPGRFAYLRALWRWLTRGIEGYEDDDDA